MARMPDQTPLPFPDGSPPEGVPGADRRPPMQAGAAPEPDAAERRSALPPTPGAPAADASTQEEAPAAERQPAAIAAEAGPASATAGMQSELPMPPPVREPMARPSSPATRRPWWARLLGRVMAPWVALKIEPDAPAEHDDGHGRPVCYVLEDYGLSNALILDRACREAGLPSPLQPLPGDPLGRKRAYVALSRRNAGGALAPLRRSTRARRSQDPFRVAGAAARGAPRATRRWTCSWCRCRSSSAARRTRPAAGSRCCSRRTGHWSAASAACWRSCSTAATPSCASPPPVSLRGMHRRGPAARTHRAQALARAAHALPTASAQAVIGPDLSTRRLLVDRVLGRRRRCARRSPTRRAATAPNARGRLEEGPRATPTRSPPTIRTRWCARLSFLLTPVWNRIYRRRAGAPPGQAQGGRARATKSSTCPATAATWTTCC